LQVPPEFDVSTAKAQSEKPWGTISWPSMQVGEEKEAEDWKIQQQPLIRVQGEGQLSL